MKTRIALALQALTTAIAAACASVFAARPWPEPLIAGGDSQTAQPVTRSSADFRRQRSTPCSLLTCVPVIGRTLDGKSPVYEIVGELDDGQYKVPSTGMVLKPQQLLGNMTFVDEADRVAGRVRCGFICKNAEGQVVGLNPELKTQRRK